MQTEKNQPAIGPVLNSPSSSFSELRRLLPADGSERWILLCMCGCILAAIFSIAASHTFLSLALAGFLYQHFYGEEVSYQRPPFWWPTLAFMITTGVAVFLSPDPLLSLRATKKFFLFLIPFLVYNRFRTFSQVDWFYRGLFVAAAVSSIYGITQYPMSSEGHRITGFLGHWMTYSNIELILFSALLTFCLYYPQKALWAVPILLLVAVAVLLSLTRSVWIGAIVASVTAVAIKRTRWLLVIPLTLLLILAISPHKVLDRAKTLLTLDDRAIEVRFNMIRVGINIIKAHPLSGIGPNRIPLVAYDYGADKSVAPWYYVHLHNNIAQLAAERGIPCLLAWLWLIFTLFCDYFRMVRRLSFRDRRSYPLAVAISALTAFLVAGMFEYNFGDSEVVMLLLFILSAPYIVDREVRAAAPAL